MVAGLATRLRLPWLLARHDRRAVVGTFAFVNGLVSIGLVALVAWLTDEPFIFPSLGPTAFLLFHRPLSPTSSPRNTLLGHAVGAAAGYGALAAFGLRSAGPAVAIGVSPPRIGAAALSLALTSGAMVWLRVAHPPAGATTLIVSLGILHTPVQVAVLLLGVALLVAQGQFINRAAGLPVARWAPHEPGTDRPTGGVGPVRRG